MAELKSLCYRPMCKCNKLKLYIILSDRQIGTLCANDQGDRKLSGEDSGRAGEAAALIVLNPFWLLIRRMVINPISIPNDY